MSVSAFYVRSASVIKGKWPTGLVQQSRSLTASRIRERVIVLHGCRPIGMADDPDQLREISGKPHVTPVIVGHRPPQVLVQDLSPYASAKHAHTRLCDSVRLCRRDP